MSGWYWVLGGIVGVVIVGYLVLWLNKRTCMLAFGRGVTDSGSISWREIEENYRSYLRRPMSPMDAAAYRRGVEYCLTCSKGADWQEMKRDFLDAWKSGAITREGTDIRKMGAEAAGIRLNLRIPKEMEAFVRSKPGYPPLMAVKMRTEIDRLVDEYLSMHPKYEFPPSGDRHPAVLAIGAQMRPWFLKRFGGPLHYWRAMLEAARIWFPPGCDSREFRIFCSIFEGEGNISSSWGGDPEFALLQSEYDVWRRQVRGL